jgi:endonuclease/exonuclease/phosphatase family metal-dependent hydrolase
MIEYKKVIKKYRDEGLLTERDLGTLQRVRFFAGNAFSKSILDSGLSNALIVNTRAGKVFSKSHTFEFKNQLLRVPGIETRGACHVRLVHPTVGAMEIYSLHLDHMWEKNRHKQIDLLMQQIWSTSALETANKHLIESGSSSPAISLHTPSGPDVETLPHIIMGDFNAITKSDYTEDFEEEHITKVREAGRWEPPTYSLMEKMKALGYVDLWRRTHPDDTDRDHEVTTCAYNTRIDYIFLSPALASMVDWTHENTYSHILNGVHHSDHFPVLGNLQFLKK